MLHFEAVNLGSLQAMAAATLFGISPVLVKHILGDMSPLLLAGLLYLGSGFGLLIIAIQKNQRPLFALCNLSKAHRLKLVGAIVSGGILAPICFAYGLKLNSAFEVSVLLNLETVATTILAAVFFHEYVGRRVWFGKALIVISAISLSLRPLETIHFSMGSFLLLGACFFWGLDNNLTRDVDELSPFLLGGTKGLVAGTLNTGLAIILGSGTVSIGQVSGTLAIGWISYGISLILFIEALRRIGASRTSAYFATSPFIGMSLAVLVLGEHPPLLHWAAATLAALGCWLLYLEHHEHTHSHEVISHIHRHNHDDHHQHSHDGSEGPEPHEHLHNNEGLTHSHAHYPDIHHRHFH